MQKMLVKIKLVTLVIGLLASSFPAVEMGPLYYRQLENDQVSLRLVKFIGF